MNERVKKVTTFVKDKWTGFSKAVKIMVVAIPIAVIAIIIILAILINHKNDAVLFTGLTTAEQGEISAAITELGVTDVRVRSNGDIIVPDDQVDYLRMQLAVKGYPKNTSNYDIWNDGVDLWSTDSDKREVARQQREALIAAALTNLNAVRRATARLDVPATKDYVITETKEAPTCSIQLELVDDYELTKAEVRAIFNLVTTSVYGLTRDNVSITDTLGRDYPWISAEDEANGLKDPSGVTVGKRRMLFQRDMQNAIKQDIDSMMTEIFGKNGYSLNVSALLNFDDVEVTDTKYIPVDENNTGVLAHDKHEQEFIDAENAGGVVGVTANGDRSPEYPTFDDLDDGEKYYYELNERQFDVSNVITKITGDGYKIDRLSVGVCINRSDMTQLERDYVASMVAAAVGADVDNVSVWNTPFALTGTGEGSWFDKGDQSGIWTRALDPYRNILLFIVIALGIILIALLILSLCMSRSRKKKIRRRQEQALAAAQAAAAADVYSGGGERDMPQDIDFNIASLTQEAGKESRETILKREIADFAKSSPEIVASIIKNMLREEG